MLTSMASAAGRGGLGVPSLPDRPETDAAKSALLAKAALKRRENVTFKIGTNGEENTMQLIRDSSVGKWTGKWGKEHRGFIADASVLPEPPTRPWCRAPQVNNKYAKGKIEGAKKMMKNPYDILILFDGRREANRKTIVKFIPESQYPHTKEMFIQVDGNTNRKRARGCGSAGDMEIMYVVPPSPLYQLKKKARLMHPGHTNSVCYTAVAPTKWKNLPQATAQQKQDIFQAQTLELATIGPAHTIKKKKVPPKAKGLLPLSWFERRSDFYVEIFDNFDLTCVVDLFGSVQMAIAALASKPRRSYLGIVQNETHRRFAEAAVDEWIVREMGRAGSPFHEAEIEDEIARLYPPIESDEEDDDDEEGKSGEEDDDDEQEKLQ